MARLRASLEGKPGTAARKGKHGGGSRARAADTGRKKPSKGKRVA
jgi:hypothetical protein